MAFRTWGRLPLTALGVSMLAGAGQLGIAYGFGVVRLDDAFADGSVNRWPAQLAWVGWFAAIAAVIGPVVTARLARRDGSPGGATEQFSVAGAAALGATVVAPLCMQPARAAELGGTVEPAWAVGICAVLGALVGAAGAIVVLLKPPFGWNIALTASVVWLLALVSVAPTVASTGSLRTVRLGVLEPSWLDAAAAQRLAMLVLPMMALLAGAAIGALARRRGHLPLAGGAAGVAGPVLLAFAYLTAGPGDPTDRYQLAPYYGALIAVAAGALGSTAATVLRRPVPAAGTDSDTDTDAIEPTDILQPLPASPATAVASAATGSGFAAPAADGKADEPGRGAPASGTPGADSPTPAHWDWPAPSGRTPAPVRPGRTLPRHTAPDDRLPEIAAAAEAASADDRVPAVEAAAETTAVDDQVPAAEPGGGTTDERIPRRAATARSGALDHRIPLVEPAAETAAPDVPVVEPLASVARLDGRDESAARDADDLTRNLPAPGLPPGRRTSAIDVLAAGRPAARPEPPPADPTATPPRHTSEPARSPAGATSTVPASVVEERSAGSAEPAAAGAERRGGERFEGDGPAAGPDRPSPATPGTGRGRRPVARSATAVPATGGLPADGATPQVGAEEPPSTPAPRGGRRSRRAPASGAKGAAGTDTTIPVTRQHERAGAPQDRTDVPASVDRPVDEQASHPDNPTTAGPAPAAPRAKSKRGRKTPATPVPAAEPVETTPEVDVPARAEVTSALPDPAAEPVGADEEWTPASPAPDAATSGKTRNYFFADEPAGPDLPGPLDPPASPRPRFPVFEDVTDRPGEVRSPWPVAPTPSRPVAPRGTTAHDDPGPSGAPDSTTAPADEAETPPAPRPRHRALPDLARPNWDTFANARPVTPVTPEASPAGGRHADPADPTDPAEGADEPDGGKSKQRRGLFRRNRAKGGDLAEPGREAEPMAAHDEEYVDWVAGLASDDDARTLRTGRHHRD